MRLIPSAILLWLAAGLLAAGDANEIFETRVRPVFARNCYACHTESKMGDLQLDSREHILKGGKSGAAIVPGHPDRSLLIQAIRQTHPRLKMPPGGKLKPEEIDAIGSWIQAGAPWPSGADPIAVKTSEYLIRPDQRAFWSFQPVRLPPVPHVREREWTRTDIDRFILAKLEEHGLRPSPPADKRVLLRRATFDLTGLPPAPEETDAFLADRSAGAFARVVDRLLASPRYGERWGRYWLDVARYSDDKLNSERDDPYPSAFRYRDWVIQAFNADMPYDEFAKSQIAGDFMADPAKHEAGLGFYALSPEMQDDRVDATTRGFLGLTVACAQCHNHKYDPIPTQDYYSLLGIFNNTEKHETPLADAASVEEWDRRQKEVGAKAKAIAEFIGAQSLQLSEILAAQLARYMAISAEVIDGSDPAKAATAGNLDAETLGRWVKYLKRPKRDGPFLKEWDEARSRKASPAELARIAEGLRERVLAIHAEKKLIDDKNRITLGLDPDRNALSNADLISLERDKWAFWEDLFGNGGVLYYGEEKIGRFLSGQWKTHLDTLQAQLAQLKKEQPPRYAYLHTIRDVPHPAAQHVYLRGDAGNPGELAPAHFLSVLSAGAPKPFTKGKERLELAEAIASADNPLTARVIVNRVWAHHFGQGLVRTPSNFGQLGDRPSHPELLDYLAARLVAGGWSLKKLHREIMLSATYALSAQSSAKNEAEDPENRLVWRASHRRLDAESLRDELLFVSGNIDLKTGGLAERFNPENRRRTVYGFVSRRRLDAVLGLFDFPNPNSTSEQRLDTNVPLQRLYFMNSAFLWEESRALAGRIEKTAEKNTTRIEMAYRLCFQRLPTPGEKRLGLQFLSETKDAWTQYTQVLLSSNEFAFLN